jgi:uncharacterized RDD family membrane protein YckC
MESYDDIEPMRPQIRKTLKEEGVVCGFWRRIFAFIIDGIILGIIGIAIGTTGYDFFAELGGWGFLLGFSIFVIYCGILNSSIGNGQTLGKRLLKIQVVDHEMETISPAKSLLRSTVFGIPYFLNGAIIPSSAESNFLVSLIIGIVVFFGCISLVYLYIFNRMTRQSLHDLIVGTYVIKTNHAQEYSFQPIWKGHYSVIGAIFVGVIVIIIVVMPKLTKSDFFSELSIVQQSIENSGLVHATTVTVGTSSGNNNQGHWENSNFSVNAILKKRPKNYDEVINKIAGIAITTYPKALSKNTITIGVSYGYDIGIANAWINKHESHSPQEWKDLLSQNDNANKI